MLTCEYTIIFSLRNIAYASRTSRTYIVLQSHILCKDRWELTPVAIQSGKLLSRRLFGGSNELMDYDMVSANTSAL